MKKKPTGTRSRHLSEEDVYLWDHTTATLKPLKRKRGRVLANAELVEDVPPRKVPAKSEPRTSAPPPKISRAPPPPAKPAHATPPPLSQFDRKAARRLRQGGIEIEARIDLHGMRQAEAHAALHSFLRSCHARKLRWVLVITGKGGPRRQAADDYDMFGGQERGVLRRNVPMWLSEPGLRSIVVSYTSAAIPHGGEGALYVQLRNPERRRT